MQDEKSTEELTITQILGDYFIEESEYLIMKVPSAMISSCYNYLVNPNHKNFRKVKIINTIAFPIKGKLFKK